jgi:hypothetical protein
MNLYLLDLLMIMLHFFTTSFTFLWNFTVGSLLSLLNPFSVLKSSTFFSSYSLFMITTVFPLSARVIARLLSNNICFIDFMPPYSSLLSVLLLFFLFIIF